MSCQSRIVREFKTQKAEVLWPETVYGPQTPQLLEGKEVCGGEVSVSVKAVDEPDWGGTSARLDLEWTCTRCKWPWVPERPRLDREALQGVINLGGLLKTEEP